MQMQNILAQRMGIQPPIQQPEMGANPPRPIVPGLGAPQMGPQPTSPIMPYRPMGPPQQPNPDVQNFLRQRINPSPQPVQPSQPPTPDPMSVLQQYLTQSGMSPQNSPMQNVFGGALKMFG